MADHRINSLVLAAGPLSSSPTSATKSAISGLMHRNKLQLIRHLVGAGTPRSFRAPLKARYCAFVSLSREGPQHAKHLVLLPRRSSRCGNAAS